MTCLRNSSDVNQKRYFKQKKFEDIIAWRNCRVGKVGNFLVWRFESEFYKNITAIVLIC